MSRLLISAAHKSSGKTTVSVGLCAAITRRGRVVQPFKKGPDYIDPMWLTAASGRACRNLDPYLMAREEIVSLFASRAAGADISVVEGNKGLYDGLALDGSDSNAALAEMLDLPVILVIDARGMTRGIAPLILGYQAFNRAIHIAGVILNNLGGRRHETKLRAVIEHYTDVPVVGAVQHDARLTVVERHLGLMPSREMDDAACRIDEIGSIIGAQVDLDRIVEIAAAAPPLAAPKTSASLTHVSGHRKVRIGLIRDKSFGFYYPDDLDALQAAGAAIVPVDALADPHLPDLDGLIIGGGFPELFMGELEANATLRTDIRAAIDRGLPVYAECGGLIYLARTLTWHGRTCRMVGAIPGDVVMHNKPVGRGYVGLTETTANPWPRLAESESIELRGHEFHYSSLENLDPHVKFAYRVTRGYGVDGEHDGIVHKNVLASYSHLRSLEAGNWATRFVAFVRQVKSTTLQRTPVKTETDTVLKKAVAA